MEVEKLRYVIIGRRFIREKDSQRNYCGTNSKATTD